LRLVNTILFVITFLPGYVLGNNTDSGIIISGNKEQYFLLSDLQEYNEGVHAIDENLALDFYKAGKFRLVRQTNSEYINLGLVNAKKWFALPVYNNNSEGLNVILEFITSEKNSIEFFNISDVKQITQVKTSDKLNFNDKPFLLSHSQTYTVQLPAGRVTTLFIHTVNRGQLLYFPGHFYTVAAFRKYDLYKNNFLGLFKGIFLFIIIFSLFLFFTTRDRIYLYYLIYAFFISIFALNEAGDAWFKPVFAQWLNFIPGQSYLLFGFAAWLFLMANFLNLDKQKNTNLRLLTSICIIDLIFGIIPVLISGLNAYSNSAFQHTYQNLFGFLFIANLVFIFNTIISGIRHKNKLAIYYAISNIPVIAGTILYYTNYFNITAVYFNWINPVALGLCIEIFLLSFGFALRYQMMGKEKQELLQQVQQEELTNQIIQTQESERKRIAQDLHDELGGNLAALTMALQRISLNEDQQGMIHSLVHKASQSARNIAHNLMPPEFIQTKLDTLLKNYFSKLNQQQDNIRFDFHIAGVVGNFDKQKELIMYRIILELTSNIIKHSAASEATVQMIYYENQLELMAEDNGRGFDIGHNTDGIGLRNIQTRINYLKGTLAIDTNTHGTTIIIQIPYHD
jgi:signal transduction histidine kinase